MQFDARAIVASVHVMIEGNGLVKLCRAYQYVSEQQRLDDERRAKLRQQYRDRVAARKTDAQIGKAAISQRHKQRVASGRQVPQPNPLSYGIGWLDRSMQFDLDGD